MQVFKSRFISLRIQGDVYQALKSVENRSEFVRNAIAAALQNKTAA